MIPFTQYLRPDGRKRKLEISRPPEIEEKAHNIIEQGFRFECEELTTGQVSVTIFDPEQEEDVCIRVIPNGSDVLVAVDKLITDFNERM